MHLMREVFEFIIIIVHMFCGNSSEIQFMKNVILKYLDKTPFDN